MLFDTIIYGPIHSRRLGVSLGVNLMPTNHKLCSFDCVYCEIGWNTPISHPRLPSRQEVAAELERALKQLEQQPDVITFSGNGEPTMHPEFEGIIADTCALRDRYCPNAKVSVLSNSTQVVREDVFRALERCDNRIMKLDSGIDRTMRLIDRPVNESLTVGSIIERLQRFHGDFTLQTCFLRGIVPDGDGQAHIDNTTDEELTAWYKAVDVLRPKQIMIYVIDRKTPCETLEKIPREKMEEIATPLREKGYEVIVSA
ncbi:MAG: radical SAM protein [Paludibacteraceae bacterium]|nr:radical SAM protein [Paludibacteraceae bacterium]